MNNDPWKMADERRFQFRLWHLFVGTLGVAVVLGVARWSMAVAAIVLVDIFLIAAFGIQIRAGRRYRRSVARLPASTYLGTLGCLGVLLFATVALLAVFLVLTLDVVRGVR